MTQLELFDTRPYCNQDFFSPLGSYSLGDFLDVTGDFFGSSRRSTRSKSNSIEQMNSFRGSIPVSSQASCLDTDLTDEEATCTQVIEVDAEVFEVPSTSKAIEQQLTTEVLEVAHTSESIEQQLATEVLEVPSTGESIEQGRSKPQEESLSDSTDEEIGDRRRFNGKVGASGWIEEYYKTRDASGKTKLSVGINHTQVARARTITISGRKAIKLELVTSPRKKWKQ